MTVNVRPLALLSALLLFVAINASYLMSASLGIVEWCVPYIDGCTSISRAGRSQPTIFFFRAMVMPAGVGMFVTILLLRQWLLSLGAPRDTRIDLITLFGFLSVAGLLVYCAFLGTDGVFRPYRRYSVITFLGFFVITQLTVCNALNRLVRRGVGTLALKRVAQAMVGVCVAQLVLGLVNILVVPFIDNNDAIENAIEWNAVTLMILYCVLVYLAWKFTGFEGRLSLATGPGARSA